MSLEKILDHINEPILIITADGKVRYGNEKWLKKFNYRDTKINSLSINDLVDKAAIKDISGGIETVLKSGFIEVQNIPIINRSGGIIKCNCSFIFLNNDKDIQSIILIAHELREVSSIENELEAESKLNQDIIDYAPFGVYIINTKGNIEYVNKSMLKISNDTYEDFVKINVFKLPSYLKSGLINKITEGLSGKYFVVKELTYTSQIGNKTTIRNFVGIPLIKNNEKKLIIIVEDVTEYKLTEKALRESEKRFKDLILNMADWVWEVNSEGKYVYTSSRVEKILGYESKEIIGKTPFEFMPKSESVKIGKIFQEIVANKKPIINLQNWNISKEGKRICILTNGVPIIDESGQLLGYRGVDKDITEEVEYRKKIETMNEFMVGREVKMIELKNEIKKLNEELKKQRDT
ncbi:PAS domain-containing protein [Patescibacteria group bacterium]|nr:PAS domain-containing protein [Patescibacteria group bacterium]